MLFGRTARLRKRAKHAPPPPLARASWRGRAPAYDATGCGCAPWPSGVETRWPCEARASRAASRVARKSSSSLCRSRLAPASPPRCRAAPGLPVRPRRAVGGVSIETGGLASGSPPVPPSSGRSLTLGAGAHPGGGPCGPAVDVRRAAGAPRAGRLRHFVWVPARRWRSRPGRVFRDEPCRPPHVVGVAAHARAGGEYSARASREVTPV
jgi:hypothetical protein